MNIMTFGLVLIFLLISFPFIMYGLINKDKIKWSKNVKKVIIFILIFIIYIVVTTILYNRGIINYNPAGLLFNFWPLILVYFGLKNVFVKNLYNKGLGVFLILIGTAFLSMHIWDFRRYSSSPGVIIVDYIRRFFEGLSYMIIPVFLVMVILIYYIYKKVKNN